MEIDNVYSGVMHTFHFLPSEWAMKRFILEQSDNKFYTSHSGLAWFGLCLNRYGQLNQALENGIPQRHGIVHADRIKSAIRTPSSGRKRFRSH